MTLIPPPTRVTSSRPGHKEQPALVVDGSPLAIIGIFVTFLRERFKEKNGPIEYIWTEDPNQTKLVIESGFEDTSTIRGKKPGIFVDKDESAYSRLIIGDRVGHRFTDGKDWQWCLSTVPVLIDCVSSRRGESAIIGDITHWSLHTSSDAIQATFSFHDMSPARLGRTTPYERDRENWTTPVYFTVQYHVRWSTVKVAPLLQEITLKLKESNKPVGEYFTEIAVHNRRLTG